MESLNREILTDFLNELLEPQNFSDYCPNGLQVEGKKDVKKIAFAVSATQDSIEKAITAQADTLIVHHGLFWKFHGARPLTGPFAKRVLPLVRAEMNLYGYHLPLDAHPEVGNAKALANHLGLEMVGSFGDRKGAPLGIWGKFPKPQKPEQVQQKLESILEHTVIHSQPESPQEIESMGIITGGANSEWADAASMGLDSYLTGEISEHDWHESREANIHMFAGGHHATEMFGIQELMNLIHHKYHVECFYIPSENPA